MIRYKVKLVGRPGRTARTAWVQSKEIGKTLVVHMGRVYGKYEFNKVDGEEVVYRFSGLVTGAPKSDMYYASYGPANGMRFYFMVPLPEKELQAYYESAGRNVVLHNAPTALLGARLKFQCDPLPWLYVYDFEDECLYYFERDSRLDYADTIAYDFYRQDGTGYAPSEQFAERTFEISASCTAYMMEHGTEGAEKAKAPKECYTIQLRGGAGAGVADRDLVVEEEPDREADIHVLDDSGITRRFSFLTRLHRVFTFDYEGVVPKPLTFVLKDLPPALKHVLVIRSGTTSIQFEVPEKPEGILRTKLCGRDVALVPDPTRKSSDAQRLYHYVIDNEIDNDDED